MYLKDIIRGEIKMDAYAVKPKEPFITKKRLSRTPASESNRKMIEYMDSHNFSFSVDESTKTLKVTITDN